LGYHKVCLTSKKSKEEKRQRPKNIFRRHDLGGCRVDDTQPDHFLHKIVHSTRVEFLHYTEKRIRLRRYFLFNILLQLLMSFLRVNFVSVLSMILSILSIIILSYGLVSYDQKICLMNGTTMAKNQSNNIGVNDIIHYMIKTNWTNFSFLYSSHFFWLSKSITNACSIHYQQFKNAFHLQCSF
jgi:hypothetical protein